MKRLFRNVICILTAIVMGSVPYLSAQAANENAYDEVTTIQDRISSISTNLADATPLETDDIQKLVSYQIKTYITTEHEAEGKTLSAGKPDTWIALADVVGNRFAYLVPLVAQEEGEIGYITMGAIEDGFAKYMLAWDTKLLDSYRKLLHSLPESVPVFFPPMQYGYQVSDENGKQFFLMAEDDTEAVNITASVAENAEQLTASYQAIRDSENGAKLESSLKKAEQIQSSKSANASVLAAVEDVRLSCEWQGTNKFVPIYYSNKTWYGGNQNWYTTSQRRNNGCGPVAACNVLYYMSTTDNKYKKLYPYSTLTQTNFLSFMDLLYGYVDPAPFGETSLSSWANDIINFASNYGVSLSSSPRSVNSSKSVCASYIKNGLTNNKPVGSLNLALAAGSGQIEAWHWVTITKYYQSANDNRWVAVSSMGERRSLDWDAYYANMASSLLKGGFAYFS